jgi:PAS domain S-box-containing protein
MTTPPHDAPRSGGDGDARDAARPTEEALRARIAHLERELAATRAERDFLYAALEHVPVGLELYDHEGVALWLNRAMVEFTGLPSAEIAVGRFNILTDPFSVVTGMVDLYRRAYAGEVVHTREFAIDLQLAAIDWGASGKQIRFRMVLCPQRDEAGRVLRVLAVMFEVTQHHVARRVAERLLATSSDEEASQLIVRELAGELDIVGARVWRTTNAPGQGLALVAQHARHRDEVAPAPPAHFAERTRDTARTQAVLRDEGDATRWEAALGDAQAHADALGVHALVAAPIAAPHGVIGVIEVGTSSRYLATQALPAMVERLAELYAEFVERSRAQRRFEALFERSPDPTLVIDADGAVLAANERARALLGSTPTSLAAIFEGFAGLDPRHAAVFDGDEPAGAPATWIERTIVDARGEAIPTETAVSLLDADLHGGTKTALLVLRDLRERLRLEAALRGSLAEKDTLLREVHHRVKNNLQIVSSLVNMQADRLTDTAAREALVECSDRVRAMSLVHQVLYGGDELGSVPLDAYTRSLAHHLQGSLDPRCAITFRLAPVRVSLEDAVPCGLILNELVTNAIKYGRLPDGGCALEIALTLRDEGFELCVLDDGPGFALPVPHGSLGVQLIHALARQLGGALTTSPRTDAARASARVSVRRRLPDDATPAH